MAKYITSESVTEGHPDKLCDLISDSLLDAYLQQDPYAHVALECMVTKNLLIISGEVTANAKIEVENIARETILSCGYDDEIIGLDGKNCEILLKIHEQSQEINYAVKNGQKLGAGDQGLMYGYATNETSSFLPPSIFYAQLLSKQLTRVRKNKTIPYLRPDGKTQVTVKLDKKGKIEFVSGIVVSAQHSPGVCVEHIREDILKNVILPIIPQNLLSEETSIHINPSGSFIEGGPSTDTGLTGRKIIVDTYGGVIPHGGGAFSGKDATKVDRSAAYMTRYVSKQIVAAGIADRCLLSVSYAIGLAEPTSVTIETFGTSKISELIIEEAITTLFDFSPQGIIEKLKLRRPIYKETSCYGHFKAEKNSLPWESLDGVLELRQLLVKK